MRRLCLVLALLLLALPAHADKKISGPITFRQPDFAISGATIGLGSAVARDIRNTGAVCDGATDDAAVITAGMAAVPGIYTIPVGLTCAIGSTVNIRASYSGIVCPAAGAAPLAGSSAMQGCGILKWIGAAAGTMVSVEPVAGAAGKSLLGMRFDGIGFQCNGTSTAAIGLQALETSLSVFDNLFFSGCTTAGLRGGDKPTTTAANFRKNQVSNIECFQSSNTAGDCIEMFTSTGSVNSDVNNNMFQNIRARLGQGNAISIYGSDTNTFINVGGSFNGTDLGSAIVFGSSRATHAGNNGNIVIGGIDGAGTEGGLIVGGTGGVDGVCSGTDFQSVSGAFNSYDIGAAITGANFAGGTTIASKTTARRVTLSQACTSNGSGLTWTIAGRVASQGMYFLNYTANSAKIPTTGTGATIFLQPMAGNISVTDASYTVLVIENGATFDNAGAVVDVELRLPVIKENMRYCFANVMGTVRIAPYPRAGQTIEIPNVGSLIGTAFGSTVKGSRACLESHRSTSGVLVWTLGSVTPGWLDGEVLSAAFPSSFTGSIAANLVTGSIAPNVVTGSISGTTLTVPAITTGGLMSLQTFSCGTCVPGSAIVSQLTGTTGSTGTYDVSPEQEVASSTITASGGWMTVSAVTTGRVGTGQTLTGAGVTGGTAVLAGGPTAGGTGGYPVSISQTVGSTAITPSGGTLVVSAIASGNLAIGDQVSGVGVTAGNDIDLFIGSTTGGVGTYLVSIGDTVGSEAMTTSLNTYTILDSQTGRTIYTDGSTIAQKFRLPVAATGLNYCFVNSTTQKIVPFGRSPSVMYVGNVTSTTGFNTSTPGNTLCVSALNVLGAIAWVAKSVTGTWAVGP